MKATIIGSTGLTGNQLLHFLLEDPKFSEVLSISRKSTGVSHPKLKELIIDLNNLKDHQDEISGDHFFCCLGTTIKKAKTKENFKKVDYEMPLQFAQIAKKKNAKSFSVISAQGVKSDSLFFYNRVKGELEQELKKLNLDTLLIYHPGLLLGERDEKRRGEDFAITLVNFLKTFIPQKKLAGFVTETKTLAQTMSENCDQFKGMNVFNSKTIYRK